MGVGKSRIENKYTGHPGIPKKVSDKLYNSIVKITINNNSGTGFLMKIKINSKQINFLLTCYHLISQNLIDSKEKLNIYYGEEDKIEKIIKLDLTDRFIKCFEEKDITIIEIIKSDHIQDTIFLYPDLNYKNGYDIYKGKKCFLAGYPIGNLYEGKHCSSGEIKDIMNIFEFVHTCDSNYGSSGSPIVSFEDQFVIGIHKSGDKKQPINYATFIGSIIDELQKAKIKERQSYNKPFNYEIFFKLIEDNIKSKKEEEIIEMEKYCTIKEYRNDYFDAHKQFSKFYDDINEKNFYICLGKLQNFVSKNNIELNSNFIELLKNFKNFEKNYDDMFEKCLDDKGFIYNINKIIRSKNKLLIENIYYFISCFSISLEKSNYGLKENRELFRGEKMNYNDLITFKNKINELFVFKGYFTCSYSREVADVYSKTYGNKELFSVIVIINYEYEDGLIPNCFVFSKLNNIIFQIFSIFKIKNVEIDENRKKAEIILDSIGRTEIIENKMMLYEKNNK